MPTKTHPSSSHPEHTARSWWAPIAGLLLSGLAATLVACGGGGGSSAGVGTGGTGSFAVGTISGFGSIIVNGVRYDDSSADVFDDDDDSSNSLLAIGQVVEIRGSVNSDGVTGTASSIAYYSALKGPVTAVNAGAGTVTVFGQVVNVTATTLFGNISGLSALAVGNVIEVYGLPDASGAITATRIEREATTINGFEGDYRIRGVVSGTVATAPGVRFTVGTVTVQVTDTSNTNVVRGTIADGVFVKVRLAKTEISPNTYSATRVRVKERVYESGVNKAEVQGLISGYTSPSAEFKVNGYPVQLGTSVTYEHGAVGNLANDVRIEGKGVVTNGVLVISKVEFDDDENEGGGDGSAAPYEFHGAAICNASPCASPSGEFVVRRGTRDVTVVYDNTTIFANSLTPSTLHNASVEVKAIAQSGSGGTTLLATRIELDD